MERLIYKTEAYNLVTSKLDNILIYMNDNRRNMIINLGNNKELDFYFCVQGYFSSGLFYELQEFSAKYNYYLIEYLDVLIPENKYKNFQTYERYRLNNSILDYNEKIGYCYLGNKHYQIINKDYFEKIKKQNESIKKYKIFKEKSFSKLIKYIGYQVEFVLKQKNVASIESKILDEIMIEINELHKLKNKEKYKEKLDKIYLIINLIILSRMKGRYVK